MKGGAWWNNDIVYLFVSHFQTPKFQSSTNTAGSPSIQIQIMSRVSLLGSSDSESEPRSEREPEPEPGSEPDSVYESSYNNINSCSGSNDGSVNSWVSISRGSESGSGSGSDDDDEQPITRPKIQISVKKTKTLEPEDRISKLPDSILVHILTFLPINDAIRTSLLSKRWDYLWVSIPSLVFRLDADHYQDDSEFISFVDRTLIRFNSEIISRFCVEFFYFKNREQNVDSWVRFAVNHKVEQLDLLFYESNIGSYNLPRFLCMNGTLTKLNLRQCCFAGEINWRSLRRLYISLCTIDDALMLKLFAACPVLESFELVQCQGFTKIDIDSVSLKKLVINGDMDAKDIRVTRIHAPNLRLLAISGYVFDIKCQFEDLSSLAEARLSYVWKGYISYYPSVREFNAVLTDSLERIKHVKKLSLRMFCLQVISQLFSRPLPCPFSVCKSLILDANLEKGGLHGITSMLQSCPELETLTIHLLSYSAVPYINGRLMYRRKSFSTAFSFQKYSSFMKHLKMVNIVGLVPGCTQTEAVIEFLQVLLKHAKVLEKLSLNMCRDGHYTSAKKDSLFEVAKALLRIPRSSPFAEIQLN